MVEFYHALKGDHFTTEEGFEVQQEENGGHIKLSQGTTLFLFEREIKKGSFHFNLVDSQGNHHNVFDGVFQLSPEELDRVIDDLTEAVKNAVLFFKSYPEQIPDLLMLTTFNMFLSKRLFPQNIIEKRQDYKEFDKVRLELSGTAKERLTLIQTYADEMAKKLTLLKQKNAILLEKKKGKGTKNEQ